MNKANKQQYMRPASLRTILLITMCIAALIPMLLFLLLFYLKALPGDGVSIFVPIAISLLLAALCAVLLSRWLLSLYNKLAEEVRGIDPEHPKALPPTQIRELDDLSSAIDEMHKNHLQHAGRMSMVIDKVGIPLGAFEMQEQNNSVFLTDSLFRLLKLPHGDSDSNKMMLEDFLALFPSVSFPKESEQSHEERIKWACKGCAIELSLDIRLLRQGDAVYGTVVDVSEEEQHKKWLEYERDYDPLTKLLNRNSYPAQMSALIKARPDKVGVLLFGDLDNLKNINDTYGHDMGDRYIQKAASALQRFEALGGVVARISGDEFAVYLHGGDTREELRKKVDKVLAHVRKGKIELQDGSQQNTRISVGLSYYPFDADNIDMLVRYADFAMYEIKNSKKDGTREFDLNSFENNSFIQHKLNQLDRLIEYRRLTFAYQPIIDVRSGAVFGYEALLRPLMREIHTPREVLTLAKDQSKLYQIEKLTLSYTLNWYKKNQRQMGARKLFINRITSQKLSKEDMGELEALMENTYDHLVMEVTNTEQSDDSEFNEKIKRIRDRGYGLALDDYGPGFHKGNFLLSLSPDFVKLDMTLVRNVDTDTTRQDLLRQIISFAESNNIGVIAQGVETHEELEMIIALGAHYVQGYYTGRPEYELDKEVHQSCEEARMCFQKHWGSGESAGS